MARLTDYEIEEEYKNFLDDAYPTYSINEMEYTASQILLNCDPIAYRAGLSDYEGTQECPDCDEVLSNCHCEAE